VPLDIEAGRQVAVSADWRLIADADATAFVSQHWVHDE